MKSRKNYVQERIKSNLFMPLTGFRRHLREMVETFLSFCNEFILFLQVFHIRRPHTKTVSAKGQAYIGKRQSAPVKPDV